MACSGNLRCNSLQVYLSRKTRRLSPRWMSPAGSLIVEKRVVSARTSFFCDAWQRASARAARTWISLHRSRQARWKVNLQNEVDAGCAAPPVAVEAAELLAEDG